MTGASYICSYSGNSSTSLWIKAAQEGLGYLAEEFLCRCGASWPANPPRCQILHPPGFLGQSHHYLVKKQIQLINITQSSPQPRTAAGHRSYQQFYLCSSPRGIESAAAESIGSTESTGKWPISISQGEILQHGSAKAASTVKKSLGTIPDSTTKVLFKHPLWG